MSQIVVTFDPGCNADPRTCALWCAALDAQAKEASDRWGFEYSPVNYFSTDVLLALKGDELEAFTADSYLCTVQTTMDMPGALGYHDDYAGVIFARVLWQGDPTSVTLSHEILELLGDKTCNVYKAMPNGKQQALELCDRVEGDTYIELGEVGQDGMPVTLSNYLLPSAFSPGSVGPWDRMGKLLTWDGMTDGGYSIVMGTDGNTTEVFALTDAGRANGEAKRAKVGGRANRRLAK